MTPVDKSVARMRVSTEQLKLDLPLYGLLGEDHGGLMILNWSEENARPQQRLFPLFSSRELALEFLDIWDDDELNQPQYVMEFGPPHIDFLADLLSDAAKHCEAMTIDPGYAIGPCVLMCRLPSWRSVWVAGV